MYMTSQTNYDPMEALENLICEKILTRMPHLGREKNTQIHYANRSEKENMVNTLCKLLHRF